MQGLDGSVGVGIERDTARRDWVVLGVARAERPVRYGSVR